MYSLVKELASEGKKKLLVFFLLEQTLISNKRLELIVLQHFYAKQIHQRYMYIESTQHARKISRERIYITDTIEW